MRNHVLFRLCPGRSDIPATDFVTDFCANKGAAVQRNDREQASASDAESDVLDALCEDSLVFATAFATEFGAAAGRSGTNSAIDDQQLGPGGWQVRWTIHLISTLACRYFNHQ